MQTYDVTAADRVFRIGIVEDGTVQLDGKALDAIVTQTTPYCYSVILDGRSISVLICKSDGMYSVCIEGVHTEIRVESEREQLLKKFSAASPNSRQRLEIRAPMPALVGKVEVSVGEDVSEGQGLIILEAMKMENEIKAHHAGRVKTIFVERGKTVEKGDLLLMLE